MHEAPQRGGHLAGRRRRDEDLMSYIPAYVFALVLLVVILKMVLHKNHKWSYVIYRGEGYYECVVCHKRREERPTKELFQ